MAAALEAIAATACGRAPATSDDRVEASTANNTSGDSGAIGRIVSADGARCLTFVPAPQKPFDEAAIRMMPCDGRGEQRWRVPSGGTEGVIAPANTWGYCLGGVGWPPYFDGPLGLHACNQYQSSPPHTTLWSIGSSIATSAQGCAEDEGEYVALAVCDGGSSQALSFAPDAPASPPATPCPPELTECGGACVMTGSDRGNCGGCGIACAAGEACDLGKCIAPDRWAYCQGVVGLELVDLNRDARNCGSCGVVCPADLCFEGRCLDPSCSISQTACGYQCVWLDHDPLHCGGCGVVCPSLSCTMGRCDP